VTKEVKKSPLSKRAVISYKVNLRMALNCFVPNVRCVIVVK